MGTTDFESAAFDHSAISPRSSERRILSGSVDLPLSAQVGPQRAGYGDRPVGPLKVLQDRHQRAPDGEGRAVQRMDKLGLALVVAPAGLHAPRLECLVIGAGGDLAVSLLRGQPDLE